MENNERLMLANLLCVTGTDLCGGPYEHDNRVKPTRLEERSLAGMPQLLFERQVEGLALQTSCRLLNFAVHATIRHQPNDSDGRCVQHPCTDPFPLEGDSLRTVPRLAALLQMDDIEPFRWNPNAREQLSSMHSNRMRTDLTEAEATGLFETIQKRSAALRILSGGVESTLRRLRPDYDFSSPCDPHDIDVDSSHRGRGRWQFRLPLFGWIEALHRMVSAACDRWMALQVQRHQNEDRKKACSNAKLAFWKLKHEYWQRLDKHSKRELASCMAELISKEEEGAKELMKENTARLKDFAAVETTAVAVERAREDAPKSVLPSAKALQQPELAPDAEMEPEPELAQELEIGVRATTGLERVNAQLAAQTLAQAQRSWRSAELESRGHE